MNIVGKDYLRTSLAQPGYFLKLVFNEQVAHFFPYSTEHRDASLPGLRYSDNSQGNALAATIKPTQIDIRLHKAFSMERIEAIIAQLELALAPTADCESFDVNYGGSHVASIKLPSELLAPCPN